jgi:ABC-type nitrate/sulfonate/bicarbonate transport system substrate-binding protein
MKLTRFIIGLLVIIPALRPIRLPSRKYLLLLITVALCPTPLHAQPPPEYQELKPVSLQLKWTHQFQFAGYYAAKEKGFFHDVGLQVTLLEGGPQIDPSHEVQAGKAEFGIGNSTLIIERSQGSPLMVIAAIFQHSPLVILAKRPPIIKHPKGLAGYTIMMEEHAAELTAYLKLAGVDFNSLNIIPHSGTVKSLQDTADAMTAYTTTEPYEAIREKIGYQLLNPRDIGIDFYSDTLFTTDTMADQSPAVVKAFRDASIRGWYYAMEHPDEIIDIILNKYGSKLGRRQLEYEANVIEQLLAADIVDIGYLSRSRWRHIADSFTKAGLISKFAHVTLSVSLPVATNA